MTTRGADFLTPDARSQLMGRVRSSGVEAENLLAAALRRRRLAFQTGGAGLPGKPDFVLPRRRLAVFVDGELWHAVQWRRRGLDTLADQFRRSRSPDYWTNKLERNRRRDIAATADLLRSGWKVLRLWESDVRNKPDDCAQAVHEAAMKPPPPGPVSLAASQTVCEFFAGMGLMRLGLDAAGWKTIWANDFDPMKRRLYEGLFPADSAAFDPRDVNLVNAADVPSCALATASFPCVDLSLAGAQRGLSRDTRSGAYFRFTDILRDMGDRRPPFVLLENVTGLLSSNRGRDLEGCLGLLNELGYAVDLFTLSAIHFTSQSRPRMFVVGAHESCGRHAEIDPATLTPDPHLRPARLVEFIRSRPALKWSIRRLPALASSPPPLSDLVEPLADDDPRWWSAPRVQHFIRQVSRRHAPQLRRQRDVPETSYATSFRRMREGASTAELRFDGVAGCLRTPKGGSAKQILVRMGGGKIAVRLLTPRECARLMGVAEYTPPPGISGDEALYGFGDAVCVPVITWIARHYLDPLLTEALRGCALVPGSPNVAARPLAPAAPEVSVRRAGVARGPAASRRRAGA